MNNKMKLLTTTVILASMMAPNSYAATSLTSGVTYGPNDNASGYEYSGIDDASITFTASGEEEGAGYFNIGNSENASLANLGSGDLTVNTTNGALDIYNSGIVFENNILETGGDIIFNANGSSLEFRGEMDGVAINVDGNSAIKFSGSDKTYNSSISIGESSVSRISFDGAGLNYSGNITAAAGSEINLELGNFGEVVSNVEFSGAATLASGNDLLLSLYGDSTTISGDVNFGGGDDAFIIADSSTTLSGALTNLENVLIENGSLIVTDGGSLTGDVSSSGYGSLEYQSSADSTFNINGAVDDVSLYISGATVNTNGNILGGETGVKTLLISEGGKLNVQDDVFIYGSDEYDGNVFLGSSGDANPSVIQIGSDAVFSAANLYSDSSTLIVDIAGPSSSGLLVLNEGNIDLRDLTIEANITGSDSLFTNGNQIKVSQGVGALIGTDGNEGQSSTAITENSVLFSINMMDGGKLSNPLSASDLYLVFERESTIKEVASSTNNRNVGAVFDSLSGTSNEELGNIISNLNAASQAELDKILESTTADISGGAVTGSQNFVNNTLDITHEQIDLAMNSRSGVASGGAYNKIRTWVQTFAQDVSQGIRKGISGYDSKTFGLALGADSKEIVEDVLVGAAFSYGNTDVDSRNANKNKTDIESYQLTLYGNKDLPHSFFLKAMTAYTYNSVDTARYNVGGLGLTAKGKYNSEIYTARTDIGKDLKYNNMRLTPSFMTHYSQYNAENYTEKGVGGANLAVNQKSLQILEFGANIEAGWDLKFNNHVIKPEVRVGYRYDVIGNNLKTNSSFVGGGTSFQTLGAKPVQGTTTVGGGIVYEANESYELSANFEHEYKKSYSSNSGFIRISYKF